MKTFVFHLLSTPNHDILIEMIEISHNDDSVILKSHNFTPLDKDQLFLGHGATWFKHIKGKWSEQLYHTNKFTRKFYQTVQRIKSVSITASYMSKQFTNSHKPWCKWGSIKNMSVTFPFRRCWTIVGSGQVPTTENPEIKAVLETSK